MRRWMYLLLTLAGCESADVDVEMCPIAPELPALLSLDDYALERRERTLDLVHLRLQMRAARDLAHEHADEVGLAPPRTQEDRRHLPQLLRRRHPRFLDVADRGE